MPIVDKHTNEVIENDVIIPYLAFEEDGKITSYRTVDYKGTVEELDVSILLTLKQKGFYNLKIEIVNGTEVLRPIKKELRKKVF